jgi:lysophospholipase L1-like esterase
VGLTPVDEEKVNPLPRDNTVSYYNEYIQNYDNQLHAICIEKGIPFISLQEIIKKADLEDGLHPNTQGHQKMCEVICKVIHR